MVVRVRFTEQRTGYIEFSTREDYEKWRNGTGTWDLDKAIQESISFRMELPDGESLSDYSGKHIKWLN